MAKTEVPGSPEQYDICYTVADVPDLNLLGQTATKKMGISVYQILDSTQPCNAVFSHLKADTKLCNQCQQICDEFPDLWKPELGCLRDYELEVEYKLQSNPIFANQSQYPLRFKKI